MRKLIVNFSQSEKSSLPHRLGGGGGSNSLLLMGEERRGSSQLTEKVRSFPQQNFMSRFGVKYWRKNTFLLFPPALVTRILISPPTLL